MSPLLEVTGLTKTFGRGAVRALDDVSFTVPSGDVVGIVGESGSGKSTAIRCLVGLERPDSGEIRYDGAELGFDRRSDRALLSRFRAEAAMVFQDPYSSLDPRLTIGRIVAEPLVVTGVAKAEIAPRVAEALERVGLPADVVDRHPRSFSGGQRQRIAIARAVVGRPRLLLCDEAVSALDVSVQAQVLNMLREMQRDLDLTVVFVAHDLAVVRYLCDSIVVMEHGRVVEQGTRSEVYDHPRADYTRSLLEAVPRVDPVAERSRRAARLAARRTSIPSIPTSIPTEESA